ncbi:hypothetical protein HYQ46_007608 [Verticillium longisporum]|nr:hypothetical protein HYQ46_007608 [Verticillium longisporum]
MSVMPSYQCGAKAIFGSSSSVPLILGGSSRVGYCMIMMQSARPEPVRMHCHMVGAVPFLSCCSAGSTLMSLLPQMPRLGSFMLSQPKTTSSRMSPASFSRLHKCAQAPTKCSCR